jgi:hypothetical protein
MGEAAILGSIGDAISGLFGWMGKAQEEKNLQEQATISYQSNLLGSSVEQSKQENRKTTIIVVSIVVVFIALIVTVILLNKKK